MLRNSPRLALSDQVLVHPKADPDNTVHRIGHLEITPAGYKQEVYSEFGRQGRIAGQTAFADDMPLRV